MMRALIIAIFMALAAPSFAEDAGGPVYGLGTKRCSEMPEWIQRMEQQKVLPWGNIEQFVDGYLTAKKVDVGDLQPRQAMRKVLDLCEVFPNMTFNQAVELFASQQR